MTVQTAILAATDVAPLIIDQGYITGRHYIPRGPGQTAAGAAPGAGSIRLFPGSFKRALTISALDARVTTLSGGGNFQLAIYANDITLGAPTGSALVSTAAISTASAAMMSSAVSGSFSADVIYWFASNCDNGTAVFTGFSSGSPFYGNEIGTATVANLFGSSTAIVGLSFAQAYGTWPDLTGQSFTEIAGAASIPLVGFKV